METCAFSPTGEILAVAGRRGYIHLVDWRAGGAQVIGSVKMNKGVKDIWWARGSVEGRMLMSLAEDSAVYVWDVAERKCVRRYQDEGGFGCNIMSGDFAGKYLAIGYVYNLLSGDVIISRFDLS
jgi:U3 small nucleolar RNA-associated protein 18